jgi:NADPH:quinone reductase-like Zn-dependent oxidoreductase
MKAIQVVDAEQRQLRQGEIERPKVGTGELLIAVRAVGVTKTELVWYPTTHQKSGEPRVGAVPGHEFSGVVAEVGEGVIGVGVGDAVFGMNDWFADGAMAEFCVTKPENVAPKPMTLTHAQAASLPIGALTAWQGYFERAKLKAGERVLVQGGAGAVGVFAVQLAKMQGAEVIATASAKTMKLVKELGADVVIDYKAERFEDKVKDVDVVFDTVGGDTRTRSEAVMKSSGRLISIAADGEVTTDPKVRDAYFIVEPRREELIAVAALVDTGKLRTFVDVVVPFEEAQRAYTGELPERLGYGKVVVQVQSD